MPWEKPYAADPLLAALLCLEAAPVWAVGGGTPGSRSERAAALLSSCPAGRRRPDERAEPTEVLAKIRRGCGCRSHGFHLKAVPAPAGQGAAAEGAREGGEMTASSP